QNFLRTKYKIKHQFILFVGTIEPRKNLTRLVEAFLHVKKKGLKLVIVGEKGWKNEDFYKMIEELDLKENVLFTGYVPDKDLVQFYRAAEMFVYPSIYEGFGIPVIEAMACGCPVITSNISSLKEIANGAAVLVNPSHTKEIAKAIETVLKNKALQAHLAHIGQLRAQKFTWEKTAKKTLDVYRSVILK
ncbi:glycosyltransferase family 4 protein, partial [Candidatus Woesearchaeota archaeon]|nr:glycosyltransferase family 4 protein [Candidatus Woesearchaeota archaeon]